MKSINKKILSIFSAVLIFTFVFSFANINKVYAYSLSITGISGTSASVGGAGFNGGTWYDLHLIKGLVNTGTIQVNTNSAGVFAKNLTNLDPSTQYTVSIFPQNSNIASIIDQSFTTTTAPSTLSSDGKIKNPIHYNTINDFIKAILRGAIKIGIPIIALAIIYSGFLFVSARGNSEKLSEAKNALLYSCIGAAILLGAWSIAQLISETILAL